MIILGVDPGLSNTGWGVVSYDGKNYRIPKNKQTHVEELSYEECMNIIKEAPEPKASRRK